MTRHFGDMEVDEGICRGNNGDILLSLTEAFEFGTMVVSYIPTVRTYSSHAVVLSVPATAEAKSKPRRGFGHSHRGPHLFV